ncbi:MAG: class I SAM-dependent methyltransferase [Thermoproteus sp.]
MSSVRQRSAPKSPSEVLKVRSPLTRRAVPSIFGQADFGGAVVVDIGAGYGAKGMYAAKRGARHVVLLDVDEEALREPDDTVDKVVGDAHFLPFKDGAADVAIFWNVLQFLHDEERALGEVARVARRYVVFSVYNAASGRRYTWEEFLERARGLGSLVRWRRLGNVQFQAVVRREDRRTS